MDHLIPQRSCQRKLTAQRSDAFCLRAHAKHGCKYVNAIVSAALLNLFTMTMTTD